MTEAMAVGQSESPAVSTMTRTIAAAPALSLEAVRAQLERILSSKAFARSPRISRFLTFVVEQTMEGQETKLKEYLLGVEVFGRMDSFDPRIDSIVRVEARRLRFKLEKYYETEGHGDSVQIQFRKGCYIPSFCEKRSGELGSGTGELDTVPYITAIDNPHAFALFARGRACLARANADGVAEAISCFTQALEQDPKCASAHAGLASAWMCSSLLDLMPARDVTPKARACAMRALALAPACSEAHSILGISTALHDWEWSEAEPRLRKAVGLNPCDLGARLWYGLYLTLCGRADDGAREARKAQQAAPGWPLAHMAVGFACHSGRRYDEALVQYRLAQHLDPSLHLPHLGMGLLFTDQNMNEQAIQSLNRAAQLQPRNPAVLAAMVYCHAAGGRTEQCRQELAELAQLAQKQYVSPLTQAMAFSAAADVDGAYRKLDEAVEDHSMWLSLIRNSPAFEAVRQDPRYQSFAERLHFA